jgi:cobalt/nickel transport system permease protein
LRRFDLRARIIAGISCILVSVDVSNPASLAFIMAACLLLLCRDFPRVVQRLVPLETFCLLFAAQSVLGLIEARTALILILRVNCAALLYMLAVVPAGIGALAQALTALRVSPKLVSILYLTHRYVCVLHDKVFCSVTAMRLRAGRRGTVFMWKAYAAVIASALASAFVKADSVSAALLARGFDGVVPLTAAQTWKTRDTFLAACAALVFVAYGTYKTYKHFFFV